MTDANADKKAAAPEPTDRGERTALMEPLRFSDGSRHRPGLADLAVELAAASAGLRRSLPQGVVKALADLVREMNCYYSNLIEGHDTHPVDIERALKGDYSTDPEKRNLQREAQAHVAVQEWIDEGGVRGRATMAEAIRECHKRFGDLLPEELLRVKDPDTGEETVVIPGELRQRDVKVGRHVPVSPGAVPRFLQRFESIYDDLGKSEPYSQQPPPITVYCGSTRSWMVMAAWHGSCRTPRSSRCWIPEPCGPLPAVSPAASRATKSTWRTAICLGATIWMAVAR